MKFDCLYFTSYLTAQLKSILSINDYFLAGIEFNKLSQPNNNPNNKTTKTAVGLELSNPWEPPTIHPPPPPPNTNSKPHDRADMKQNSENKNY